MSTRRRTEPRTSRLTAEGRRLEETHARTVHWRRWGPYLADRQWGTVREDYSAHGTAWDSFPHDHARSRAYRWGEDGIAGISDNHGRLCFALALWNGRDPILKERLFGLTGPEGNHGEDVKEYYFYLDSTPTHSYMRALYKYPQAAFPYDALVEENRRRDRRAPEFELIDTGVLDSDRYFDVTVEYAKASAEDILARISVANRGSEPAELHLLPTLWFRNTWAWDPGAARPRLQAVAGEAAIDVEHAALGRRRLSCDGEPTLLFTDNDTNAARLWGAPNAGSFAKDGINDYVVDGRKDAVNADAVGTKAAAHYRLTVPAGASATVRLRLHAAAAPTPFGRDFEAVFARRIREADEFYATVIPDALSADARLVMRQAFAGLLWSKQFFHYDVRRWLQGDPAGPPPSASRQAGRNREWYMHPNGQIPAYEWAFGDVNPPVHAWAALRVYRIERRLRGAGDRDFLQRVFHKLLLNFTWWVNRKDAEGKNVFQGGFLGLDNIGVFDRSAPLPTGGHIEQSDGTAWMGMYCLNMLAIALELAKEDPSYEDVASKFFEHFVYIAHAMDDLGHEGISLWDEADGFYYDVLHADGHHQPLKVRSLVGLVPLFAVETLEPAVIDALPGFKRRMQWFIDNRPELREHVQLATGRDGGTRRLLSIVSSAQLPRVLRFMLDEREFLSPHGVRAVSRYHAEHPYVFRLGEAEHRVSYEPAESSSGLFGGNSNWRGPIWFPMNYLLIESLQKFHHFYGDGLMVPFPTGAERRLNLWDVAAEISRRLTRIFLRGADGRRPVHGGAEKFQVDPHWRDLVLFYEYFHGDDGSGIGASHQTGWTALVAKLLQQSGE
jgi:hypothetical protein